MEFWGVEVKGGEPLKVKPDFESVIHLSQAALGESKKEKGNESVPLFVKIGDQKLVLGTLSSNNFPHISFDLVFEKEFELSHNWKNGTVSFTGYQSALPDEGFSGGSDLDSSEDEEVELPSVNAENGKVEVKVEKAKPATPKANVGKPAESKAKLVQPSKDNEAGEDDESDDDDESDEDEESAEGMSVDEDSDEDDDDDDDSESEDEETPKKAEPVKKRPNDSATKTPVPSKKAKSATPQKTDGKKVGQLTPHPAKNAGKTTANGKQTPKSGSQFPCNSCERSFGSDGALQSHSKAKHSGK